MALTYNHTTLTAAIVDYTEDDGTEFAAEVNDFIGKAELRCLRDLDLELFDAVATGNLTGGNAFLVKPADYLAFRSFYYTDGSSNRQPLIEKSYEFAVDYWPNAASTTAAPKYFAEYSTTQLLIAGTPASNLAYTLRYMARPTAMSAGNPTTWLGTNVPDLLFNASMTEAQLFLKAYDEAKLWEGRYRQTLEAAKDELRRTTRNDYAPMTTTPTKEAE